MTIDVVLIRPAGTEYDEQNRLQGRLDLPLTPHGESLLAELAAQLQVAPMQLFYTAPCEPARSTAVALGEAFDMTVKELEGLSNLDQGFWQGLQIDQLKQKQGKTFRQWQECPEAVCPPGGETVESAWERVRKALEKPLKRGIPFALVVPEPLATLVHSYLTGRKLDFTACCCPEQRAKPRWEVITAGEPVSAH